MVASNLLGMQSLKNANPRKRVSKKVMTLTNWWNVEAQRYQVQAVTS